MTFLIDLSHLGLLSVSGEGAKTFLQGQLTCHLDELHDHSRLGAACNPQGRIISFFRIFFYQDTYYLQMPADIVTNTLTALQKYAVFFKVTLQDASKTLQCISYSGPDADKDLGQFFENLPMNTDDIIQSNNLLILKLPGIFPHYEIIGSEKNLQPITQQLKTAQAISPMNRWKYNQIMAGIPSIYTTTQHTLLPHEINLQQINALSFNKGCYTGQEIIARMHYRGQLKKHMYRARVITQKEPPPGQEIFPAGVVVDSCSDGENTYQLLIIANQTDVQNNQLFLDPHQKEPLEILSLPYTG
jgi:folate-binding protein YgfZ